MALTHIEHFLVAADDIDATRDWYARVLGMTSGPHPDFGFPVHWMYVGGVDIVHIGPSAKQAGDIQKKYLGRTSQKSSGYCWQDSGLHERPVLAMSRDRNGSLSDCRKPAHYRSSACRPHCLYTHQIGGVQRSEGARREARLSPIFCAIPSMDAENRPNVSWLGPKS